MMAGTAQPLCPPPSKARGYATGTAKLYSNAGSSAQLSESEIQLLSCPHCKLVVRDPRQVTACGCRYCAGCVEHLTSGSKDPFKCIVDGTEYQKSDVRNDRGCQREIDSLEVDCPTQPQPCTWRGKLTTMEVHLAVCPNRMILCSQGCGRHYRGDELESHMISECANRQVECQYCSEKFPMQTIQDHHTNCQLAPIECEFCYQVLEAKAKLSQHHEVCVEYRVTCPYNECSFKGRKQEMNEHLMLSHIFQIAQEYKNARDEMATMKSENRALRSEVRDLTSQVDRLLQSNKVKEDEIRELEKCVKQEKGDTCREHAMVSKQQNMELVETDSVVPVERRAGEMLSTDKRLASGTTRDAGYLTGGIEVRSGGGQVVDSQLRKMSESILEIQSTITQYGTAIEDLRLRQDILDVKTTNGILIWKIPDVRRRYREAVERKAISLYSPPFYTSSHGYRVCIRAYLNGDGIGKGTHISLFFFIMRSEQDNLLSWPFKQSVRFTLVHQKKSSQSITEAFVPDPNSPSFKKPELDMNIASGFPKFARQSVLQDEGFTQDNLIYIKCKVDLSGLSPV